MCGAQRNLLLLAIIVVPVVGMWLLAEPILKGWGQKAHICRDAGHFLWFSIPTAVAFFSFELIKRWLQVQSFMVPITYASLVMLVNLVISLLITVTGLGWGLAGGALSLAVAYTCG